MKRIDEITGSLEEVLSQCVVRWVDREADWHAFPDAEREGYRRSQHRYVGTGGSPKTGAANIIPPGSFNISVMTIPAGQGTTSHTHHVDEAFFVLKGMLTLFLEDQSGNRAETVLGPWDCTCRPAGVMAGVFNHTVEPAYVQVVLPSQNTIPIEHRDHGKEHETL